MTRNRYIGRQLRDALRASRWDAGTLALRLYLPRELMARALVGDEQVSLRVYELVAGELDCNIECVSVASVKALVESDPGILRGTPVFVGSRVPIDTVLASLGKGIGMERLRASYPFLTPAHVRAARLYVQEHPPAAAGRLVETLVDAVQRKLRTIDASTRAGERSQGRSWDSFADGPRVSDDFMPERSGGAGVRGGC